MDKKSEKRAENFSKLEVKSLIELVKKYQFIVESKESYAISWKQKEETWEKIANEFNNIVGANRTSKNLKTKWDNIKKSTKKKFAQEKCELYKTGGGSFPYSNLITEIEIAVKDIIGVSLTGLESEYDSDQTHLLDKPKSPLTPIDYMNQVVEDEDFLAVDGSLLKKPINANVCTSWATWNPAKLKQTVSPELTSAALRLSDSFTPDSAVAVPRVPPKRKQHETGVQPRETIKKKTQLTEDCRVKTNVLSQAKIELIAIQKECLQKEIQYKKEEHDLRIKHMEDDQNMKMEKHDLEV